MAPNYRNFSTFILIASAGLLVGSASADDANVQCAKVMDCAQLAVTAAKKSASDLAHATAEIQDLRARLQNLTADIDNLKKSTEAKSLATAVLSATALTVRHHPAPSVNYDAIACQTGEVLLAGYCVGGNPRYDLVGDKFGDGAQAATGPFFLDKDSFDGKDTGQMVRVVCRPYADVKTVTAFAICAKPKS